MIARLIVLAGAALLLAGAARKPIVAATGGLRIVSSKIDLPGDDIAIEGDADAPLVQMNCLACHSASMITVQPKMDAAHWAAEVDKMRGVYKAPVSDEDATRLPAILARMQAAR